MKRIKGKAAKTTAMAMALVILVGLIGPSLLVSGSVATITQRSELGPFEHYNGILFDTLEGEQADIEGAVAVGKHAKLATKLNSYDLGAAAAGAYNKIGLYENPNNYPTFLLNGQFTLGAKGRSVEIYGGPFVLNETQKTAYESGYQIRQKPQYSEKNITNAFFDDALEATLRSSRAISIANTKPTATYASNKVIGWNVASNVYGDGSGGYSNLKPDNLQIPSDTNLDLNRVAIINITSNKQLTIDNLPITKALVNAHDLIIFNFVNAESVTFSGVSVSVSDGMGTPSTSSPNGTAQNALMAELAGKVIYNFPVATSLYAQWCGVVGSVIAPHADFDTNGGSLNGMLIANSLKACNGFELHAFAMKKEVFDFGNEDEQVEGSVTLYKTESGSGNLLSGAVFELYKKDGSAWKKVTQTDDKGKTIVYETDRYGALAITGLEEGDYKLVETKAPEGFEIGPDKEYPFTITAKKPDHTFAVGDVENDRLSLNAWFTKRDADDAAILLKNAEFALYKSHMTDRGTLNMEVIADSLISDDNGLVVLPTLSEGFYYLLETQAPEGYGTGAANVYQLEVYAANNKLGLNAYRLDADLDDYDLNSLEELEITPLAKTDLGAAQQGDGSFSFVIDNHKTAPAAEGRFVLMKKDDTTGAPLQGARFLLEYETSPGVWANYNSYATNAFGIIEVDELPEGKYRVTEIKAPTGYELDATPFEFSILNGSAAGLLVTRTVSNTPISTKLILTKVDGDKPTLALDDAQFYLYRSAQQDGHLLFSLVKNKLSGDYLYTSGENGTTGEIELSGLVPGHYYLTEALAPDGYDVVKNTVWQIKVALVKAANGTDDVAKVTAVNKLTLPDNFDWSAEAVANDDSQVHSEPLDMNAALLPVENYAITGRVIIHKQGDDGALLSGVSFRLFKWSDYSNNYAAYNNVTYTTNELGIIEIEDLPFGKYWLYESSSAPGYINANNDAAERYFTIGADTSAGETLLYELNIVNPARLLEKIEFTKVGSDTNGPLAGAQFTLYKSRRDDAGFNLDVVKNITTGNDGKVVLENLSQGYYYLAETRAPDGYELNDLVYQIYVYDNNGTMKYDLGVVTNYNPATGTGNVTPTSNHTITNTKTADALGAIMLQKWDMENGVSLAGAEFELWASTANPVMPAGLPLAPHAIGDSALRSPNEPVGDPAGEAEEPGDLTTTTEPPASEAPKSSAAEETTGAADSSSEEKTAAESATTAQADDPAAGDNSAQTTGTSGEGANDESDDGAADTDTSAGTENSDAAADDVASDSSSMAGNSDDDSAEAVDNSGPDAVNTDRDTENPGATNGDDTDNDVETETGDTGDMGTTVEDTPPRNSPAAAPVPAGGPVTLGDGTPSSIDLDNDSNWEKVRTADSNSFGLVTFSGLPQGDYVVRESKAPAGHTTASPNQWRFTISDAAGGSLYYHRMVDNPPKTAEITLTKTDGTAPLGGAEFMLYRSSRNTDGSLLLLLEQTGITSAGGTGRIKLEDLREGYYYLIETKTPAGHEPLDYVVQIAVQYENDDLIAKAYGIYYDDIDTDALAYLEGAVKVPLGNNTIVNEKETLYGDLTVQKYDEATGAALAGAVFALYEADTSTGDKTDVLVARRTTDQSGRIHFTSVPVGKYWLVEETSPAGYAPGALGQTEWRVTITDPSLDALSATLPIPNKAFSKNITFDKRDENGVASLEGAEFNLYKSAPNGDGTLDFNYIDTHVSGPNGRFTLTGLTAGNYYLVETHAPGGYWLEHTYKVIQIQVYLDDGESDNLGIRVRVLDLPNAGSYDLANLVNIPNDQQSWDDAEIISRETGTGVYPITNDPIPNLLGRYVLQKLGVDSDGDYLGLSGAEFKLYYSENEPAKLTDTGEYTYHSTHISNAFGYVIIDDLRAGYYLIKETQAPTGYEIADGLDGVRTFAVKQTDPPQTSVTIVDPDPVKNQAVLSAVRAMKFSALEEGEALQGTKFTLYAWANKPPSVSGNASAGIAPMEVGTKNSDENGEVVFDELPLGWYTLREVDSTFGYDRNIEEVLDANGQSIRDNPNIFSVSYNEIAFEVTGDIDPHTDDINGGYEFVYNVYNPLLYGDVELEKNLVILSEPGGSFVSSTAFDGAQFTLYVQEERDGIKGYYPYGGNNVYTTIGGKLKVEKLPVGRYRLVETARPSQAGLEYIDSDGYTVQFDIMPNATSDGIEVLGTIVVNNYAVQTPYVPTTALNLRKVNEDDPNETLGGAWFQLHTQSGGSWVTNGRIYYTNAEGELAISGLAEGSYYLEEVKAPGNFGYDSPPKAYFNVRFDAAENPTIELVATEGSANITLAGSNGSYTLTVPNASDPQVPGLELYKIDGSTYDRDNQSFTPLPGAEFALYRSYTGAEGTYNLYGTVTSNAVGMITLPYLEQGYYELVETKAPDGYLLKDGGEEANTYRFRVWQDTSGSWLGEYNGVHLSDADDMLYVILNQPMVTITDPDGGEYPDTDGNGPGGNDGGSTNGGNGGNLNGGTNEGGSGSNKSAVVATGDVAAPLLYLLASLGAGLTLAAIATVKMRRGTKRKR